MKIRMPQLIIIGSLTLASGATLGYAGPKPDAGAAGCLGAGGFAGFPAARGAVSIKQPLND